MAKCIEVIVRGVCIKNGQLLLCRTKGEENTYLPGGHIDFDESAEVALIREIREELGVESEPDSFLGAVEHRFLQDGELHCEINLVFELAIDAVEPDDIPVSVEDHIEFLWYPIHELPDSCLQPSILIENLPHWLIHGTGWCSSY